MQRHNASHLRRGQANRGFDQCRIKVKHDRITPGGDAQPVGRGTVVGEVNHHTGFIALVQGHSGIAQTELDEIIKPNKPNHPSVSFERGVFDLGKLVLVQTQAKAEVVNHQTNSIGVGDGIGIDTCGEDLAVAIGVSAVRAAHADKGLDMAGTDGEGVGQHRRAQTKRILRRKSLRTTLLKRKRAADIDKLGNLQRGIVQAGTDSGTRHVQQNGRSTCG